MHPSLALSTYFDDIMAHLHADRVVRREGGFNRIVNRTKPIPEKIEKKDGCALICMTKSEPTTTGASELLRQKLLIRLEKYAKMYSHRAWEFIRSFCVDEYKVNSFARIIGLCYFENGGKWKHVTDEDTKKGGLPNMYWWIVRKTILFPTWTAYFSCPTLYHKFKEKRIRDEETCLGKVV